jgi:O-antigen ligase
VRRITRYLLWLFVFSVPWGVVGSFEGIGTITRLLGMATIGAGVLTTITEGRIRKPGVIFWFALAFAIYSMLSLFWTITYPDTAERAGTYLQYVGLIWVVREFVRTRDEMDSLLLAFCLGAFVFAVDLLRNFNADIRLRGNETRYSATGVNANYVGFALLIGFPMAWRLFLHHRGAVRVMASLYCLVAPVAMLLTAGRNSFIASCVAILIVPLTLPRGSFSSFLRVTVLVSAVAVTIGLIVPKASWDRLLTIRDEVEGGTLSGRTQVWDAGRRLAQERPILGFGVGAFLAATEPVLNRRSAAHSMPLCILVEQGIVGLCLFAGLIGACAWNVLGLPSPDRKLWAVLMLAWLISGMSGDAHNDKITWLLFGLLAAQCAIKTPRHIPEPSLGPARAAAGEVLLRPASAWPITSISARH